MKTPAKVNELLIPRNTPGSVTKECQVKLLEQLTCYSLSRVHIRNLGQSKVLHNECVAVQ